MSKRREHFGDRKDGVLLRELDSLHFITGVIYPNRCDNEAYISETIDLRPIDAYLEKKNADGPVYKYNLFQVLVAAVTKTITLRPKLNRFIVNSNFYQRKEVSAAFVVKKLFSDSGAEALAFLHLTDDDTIDTIHDRIYEQVSFCRSDSVDSSTDSMDMFNKMPRWLGKLIVRIIMFLDRHGWVPDSLVATDPYYSSVVLSNVGSIKLKSGYHHLTNWGTCSLFLLLGQIRDKVVLRPDGTTETYPVADIGLTIDERIADGYYYAKSVRLLKTLLEHPELLETPLAEEVAY